MKGGIAVALMKRLLTLAALAALFAAGPALASDLDTCKQCHADKVADMAKTLHGQTGLKNSPAANLGCQSCHGDASQHVKASGGTKLGLIRMSAKDVPADVKDEKCLSCHVTSRNLAYWDMSKHKVQDVACADCHNIHGTDKGARVAGATAFPNSRLLKGPGLIPQSDTCFTCHKDKRLQANKPSHHPVVEGKIACADCHNPHGSPTAGMIKADSVNQLCTTCHAEKRGPFVFQHAPVEENCLTCHNPHGTNYNKLLSEKVPNVCQDCHDWSRHPGTVYGGQGAQGGTSPNTRFFARSCMNCHNQIHGSNAAGSSGQFFTR